MSNPSHETRRISVARENGPEPLQEAYKFFSSKLLDAIRNRGSVRIGTTASFRVQDGIDDGRGDPREMANHWKPGDAISINQHHPMMHHIMRAGNIEWPSDLPDLNVEIEAGASFRMDIDAYILCLSDTLNEQLCHGMLERFGYDMVYHIPNLERFIEALANVDQRLATGMCSHVRYDAPEGFERTWHDQTFRKRSRFSWQREIRLVWGGEAPLEPFTIEVPEIVPLISISHNPAA